MIYTQANTDCVPLSVCKELSDSQPTAICACTNIDSVPVDSSHSQRTVCQASSSKHKYGGIGVTWALNFTYVLLLTLPLCMEVKAWHDGKSEFHSYTEVEQQWPDRQLNVTRTPTDLVLLLLLLSLLSSSSSLSSNFSLLSFGWEIFTYLAMQ